MKQSENKNSLSTEEQEFILNTIKHDIIGFCREQGFSENEIIDFLKNQIRGVQITKPDDAYSRFFIDRLQREIAILNGTYDELYLNKIKSIKDSVERAQTLAAKYFALYHWVLIDMGKESVFEKNENDQWIKSKIQTFAHKRYGHGSKRKITLRSCQRFYYEFISLDITNKEAIARSFGSDYKEKLIQISDYDADVIHHLKTYPN